MTKRILFIGHEGSRTGAPIVLLHFLRWLRKQRPGLHIDLLLLDGGELEEEYKKVCNTYVLPARQVPSMASRSIRRIRKALYGGSAMIDRSVAPFDTHYDIVVGNTVLTLEYLAFFTRTNVRTICWVHELRNSLASYFTDRQFVKLAESVDHFIAASGAVKAMLDNFRIAKPTDVVYEFSELESAHGSHPETTRNEIAIPPDVFVVGGCGTIDRRKGVDIFVEVAACVALRSPSVSFLWIGGGDLKTSAEFERIEARIEEIGLKGRVIFSGRTEQPGKYFRTIDLFALTSREDPFPLACLEAASLGKPIVCFDGAGGMPEFVGDDAGGVVPYGDIEAFCDEVLFFFNNPSDLRRAGQAANEKAAGPFSMEESCKSIDRILFEGSNGKT